MMQRPDQPAEDGADPTLGLFATDVDASASAGVDRNRTAPMVPLPGDDGTASEFTERDSTSQESTAAPDVSGWEETGVAAPAPSPSPESRELSAGREMPEPGKVLFGTYHVERQLGGGSMGTVWLVRNLELDTLRALKLIVPSIAFDPDAQARFKREAQVMARVKHPNAVSVHAARITRDVAYIEMEYVSGQSLDRILKKGIPMDLKWVARILAQLCEVLQEAHDNQVVHRDLKPSNLMMVDSLNPSRIQLKVLDFGIAKVLENDKSDVHTSTGLFMGTAQYTSPEQASAADIDHRSDIYSVGVILYELLTGFRPFIGPVHQLIFGHLYSQPPRFADRTPPVAVSPEIEEVVFRCLAKKPDERPQSALAVIDAFSTAVFGVPSPPAPGPASWSVSIQDRGDTPGSVRSANLPPTEKAIQAGEQEASPAWAPRPAEKDLEDDDDWESPPTPNTFPDRGKRSRRTWIFLAVLVVVLVPASLLLYLIPYFGPGVPPGYRAESRLVTVNGLPRVLIREPDGPRFIRIEGGDFRMGTDDDPDVEGKGDDQPAHPVTLSDYYIQATEVTNGEMEAYFIEQKIALEKRPGRWLEAVKRIDNAGFVAKEYPAVGITHELAERFARWRGGRLPTEAEWEYAARSRGQKRLYVWGDEPMPDNSMANIESFGTYGGFDTVEVGKKESDRTEQGILDLTGNVREWCRDLWAPYPSSTAPLRGPQGAAASEKGKGEHVVRGGSFATFKDQFRTTRPRRLLSGDTAFKQVAEDGSSVDLGFRIVLEWPRPSLPTPGDSRPEKASHP